MGSKSWSFDEIQNIKLLQTERDILQLLDQLRNIISYTSQSDKEPEYSSFAA